MNISSQLYDGAPLGYSNSLPETSAIPIIPEWDIGPSPYIPAYNPLSHGSPNIHLPSNTISNTYLTFQASMCLPFINSLVTGKTPNIGSNCSQLQPNLLSDIPLLDQNISKGNSIYGFKPPPPLQTGSQCNTVTERMNYNETMTASLVDAQDELPLHSLAVSKLFSLLNTEYSSQHPKHD